MTFTDDNGNDNTHPTHSANSFVLGTVAESMTILTWAGRRISTSSHTTPLWWEEKKNKIHEF